MTGASLLFLHSTHITGISELIPVFQDQSVDGLRDLMDSYDLQCFFKCRHNFSYQACVCVQINHQWVQSVLIYLMPNIREGTLGATLFNFKSYKYMQGWMTLILLDNHICRIFFQVCITFDIMMRLINSWFCNIKRCIIYKITCLGLFLWSIPPHMWGMVLGTKHSPQSVYVMA